jgi:hypothetical protein
MSRVSGARGFVFFQSVIVAGLSIGIGGKNETNRSGSIGGVYRNAIICARHSMRTA